MKTILIAEDEVDIAETLQSYLQWAGFRVLVAFDGRDALHKAIENTPDLILTDMMMPRMDGPELIQALLATPATQHIPIITMSAAQQRSNPLPFFRKPFDLPTLVAEIRRLLGEQGSC
jgi:CheY-like chemotaxis protein